VKPACKEATGRERKEVKVQPTGKRAKPVHERATGKLHPLSYWLASSLPPPTPCSYIQVHFPPPHTSS